MARYDVTVTVNFPNDTETEINAAAQTPFAKIGEMVEFALLANGIKEGDWSSLVVSIISPDAVASPSRDKPTLRIV